MPTATVKALAGTPCRCGADAVEVVVEVGGGRIVEIVDTRCRLMTEPPRLCEFCFDEPTHHGYCAGHWADFLERREHAL